MNEFKTYHPIVNFTYFVFVIGFTCFFMHPFCLAVSLVSGFTYLVMLNGKKAIKNNLIYMLPMLFIMALVNPAFNHEGVTIIGYLPSGNPLTLESIIYGISTAAMIVSVILQFYCYNEVITSDKFLYLFGKIAPGLSIIFSMTLRFVPQFASQLKVVINAQKCMGRDVSKGGILKRVKNALNILSIMTTWSLENAIDTADSMKARGYGLPKRTTFSIYTFDKRDKFALSLILFSGIYTFVGTMMGETDFLYFPSIQMTDISAYGISVFVAYMILCMCPVIIELWEARRWKAYISKI